jgi:hypothetical protein
MGVGCFGASHRQGPDLEGFEAREVEATTPIYEGLGDSD